MPPSGNASAIGRCPKRKSKERTFTDDARVVIVNP